MNVVPFCNCPSCGTFGLHFMPRVKMGRDYKFGVVARAMPIPVISWYDGRETDKEPTMIRTSYESGFIEVLVYWIVRQCFNCEQEWDEEWKRETIGATNLG